MRHTRSLLVAGTLVLAVGIGTTVALTTRQAPTAAGQPAAVAAPSGPITAPAPTTPTAPGAPDKPTTAHPTDGAKAVATARAFLARELDMTDMVAGPFRSTGARTGEVGFRHKYGEGRRLLPQTGPYAVVARLQRLPAGWWVLGVDGRSLHPDTPARLQRIGSPLTVAGIAEVYEGTVYVKVTQDRSGRDLILGEGFLTGGGDRPGGFRGQVSFRQPTGSTAGWVIFYEASADGSPGPIQAAAVRVQFATTRAPRILEVTTSPRLRALEGGSWLELPPGPGTVVFSVKATDAQRVRFVLTPTGTGTGPYAELLGEDRDPRDGFTLTWRYPDRSLSAHLDIQAIGKGGTADRSFGIAQEQR